MNPSTSLLRFLIPSVLAVLAAGAAHAQTGLGYTLMVKTGTLHPAGSGSFTDLGVPTIEGADVVFCSDLTGGGQGIFQHAGGELSLLADRNSPGVKPPQGTANFFQQIARLSSSSAIGFETSETPGVALWSGGSLSVKVNGSTPVPNRPGEFFTSALSTPVLDGTNIAFAARSGVRSGIYLYHIGTSTLSMAVDDTIPIPSGTGTFQGVDQVAANGGRIVFHGKGTEDQAGIYLRNASGTLMRIADKTTSFTGGTGTFASFSAPALVGTSVVFYGQSSAGQTAIFQSSANTMKRIAGQTTPVPSGFGNFLGFSPVVAYSGNSVLFRATHGNGAGLYLHTLATNTTAMLLRSVTSGSALDRSIGGKEVRSFRIGPSALDGRRMAAVVEFEPPGIGVPPDHAIYTAECASYARAASGNWSDATNWTFNAVPGPASSALISSSTALTITGPSAPATVRALEMIAVGNDPQTPSLRLQAGGPITATHGVFVGGSRVTGTGTLIPGSGQSVDLASHNGLAVIAPGVNGLGAITLGSAAQPCTVNFKAASELHMDINAAGQCDTLTIHGDLNIGPPEVRLHVNVLNEMSGDDYVLATYTGNRTGEFVVTGFNFEGVPDGYVVDYSTPGRIILKSQLPPDGDEDDDGIADEWELDHAGDLTTFTATSDSDHDGATDAAEYAANTDPLDAAQNLKVTEFEVNSYPEDPEDPETPWATDISVTWTSRENVSYRLESAPSPAGPWEVQEEGIVQEEGNTASGGFTLYEVPSRVFVRVTAYRP